MKYALFAGLGLFITSVNVFSAEETPSLAESNLFKSLVRGCEEVDLSKWKHPVLEIILKSPDVKLRSVQLCNEKKYPVFSVDFKYDPQGDTQDYYQKLFKRVYHANGYWPYSFVDYADNLIISIEAKEKHSLKINYEDFK